MEYKNLWVCLLVLPFVFSCAKTGKEEQESERELFCLTDSLKQVISLDTVFCQPLKRELLLNGRIDFDMDKVTPVYSMLSGNVLTVNAEVGDYVEKGSVLASIRSQEIAELSKERQAAEQQKRVAERNLQAAEDMYASGMISDRDRLEASQALSDANAELQRIHKLYDLYPTDHDTYYLLKAPVSGFITERNINANRSIRPDQEEELFTIAGLEKVWVTADVYESDINKVKEKQPVRITTLAYKDKEFAGEVDRIYQVLDQESKTMRIRIKLDNPKYLLKPGMFANVYVTRQEDEQMLPCIPATSVIFENGHQYVVIVSTQGSFQKREISIYKQNQTVCFVDKGLEQGDVLVNHNSLLVYNALK